MQILCIWELHPIYVVTEINKSHAFSFLLNIKIFECPNYFVSELISIFFASQFSLPDNRELPVGFS